MSMTSRSAALALVCTTMWAISAGAQDYPIRQINMVIPFPPGGNTDLMARALQPELAKALGQSVVAINKGGAGGTIGNIEVTTSRADGYTIGLTPNNPLTAQPHVQKLPYGMDSFKYVCLTYYVPYVVMASPKAPFKTFQEFVAYTKAKSDNLIYASPGPGTQPHLGILSALGAIKGEGVHVPFTGAGPMSQAMLAGTVMAMSESTAVAKASNLIVLAAQTKDRIPSPAGCADHARAGLPVRGVQRRRTGGASRHPRRDRRAPAEGLRARRLQARATRTPPRSSTPTRGSCPALNSAEMFDRGLAAQRRCGQGGRAGTQVRTDTR